MLVKLKQLFTLVAQKHHANPKLFWLRVCVVFGVIVAFILKRSFWTPDTLFIILLAVAVVFGQAQAFVRRFLPFVALLLIYDSFRGIADDLNKTVHFFEMINFDLWLAAGNLPTAVLQAWWWHGSVQWYDFYFYFLYTLHFVIPMLLAVVIWKKRDSLYWPFVTALLILSFSAFITYIVFPAAPPWMASDYGFIQPIHRISSDIWYAMGITNFSEVYSNISPNAVAAVPSLHAAYPTLVFLFALKLFGLKKAWWLAFYPLSIWVGIVYLGEHYIFDAILGVAYAIAAYHLSFTIFKKLHKPKNAQSEQLEQ